MAEVASNAPIGATRLKQIAEDNSILKALIAESTTTTNGTPTYKFAVNSTIVQHLVPTSRLNKSRGTDTAGADEAAAEAAKSTSAPATGTDGKPHVGRRGMHSAQAAYWNEKTDGMWTYKYEGGESKGFDIIIMVLWIAYDSGSRS
ncbi:MAG: hypothetical protein SEPTF4163_006173 [Sporothrix epigloea]